MYKATARKPAAGTVGFVMAIRLLTRFGPKALPAVTGGPAAAELMLACPEQEASSDRDLGNVNSTPHHPRTVDQGPHLPPLPIRPGAHQTVIWSSPFTPPQHLTPPDTHAEWVNKCAIFTTFHLQLVSLGHLNLLGLPIIPPTAYL